jgi:acyl-CoA synthetase (NDP forming)
VQSTFAHPLDALFHARSIALVGVSGDPRKMTGAPLEILRQTGFAGSIFPVNPRYADLGGLPCYPDIASLPEVPDVALVMLAASQVPSAIQACADRGVGAVVVLSSGFEESDDGRQYATELARVARDARMPVVGPNCEGVWSVRDRVLLTFGSAARRSVLYHAPVAVLSQSGAIAGAMGRHLQDRQVGCAYIVSVGNETVLTIADYLEWMIEQDDVRVVLLFIEGLRDGARLLALVDRARTRGIRVVALKTGNSAAGQKAAASHTGKIASPYAIYRDLLAEAGALQVQSLTDLIDAAEVLCASPLPAERGPQGGVSVFSIPGGTRAMTADLLELQDVPLATFAPQTVQALAAALPGFGGTENPTDLTGQVLSQPNLFDECLHIIARDPHSEALIVQVANRGPRDVAERTGLLAEVAATTSLPVVVSFLGDWLPVQERAPLHAAGIACARDPAEAARYLGWLYRTRDIAARPAFAPHVDASPVRAPASWSDTVDYLRDCGVAVPASVVVAGGDDGREACKSLRFPVAVKALPEDCDHKTELGVVMLGIASVDAVVAAVSEVRRKLRRANTGVLVQEMVADGVEVLLSALRNPDFGAVLALGSGGTAVELHRDVAYLALPTDPARVRRALARLKLSTLLRGFRGRPGADTDALVNAAVRFGARFTQVAGEIAEMEVNPLFVLPGNAGVVAVDALVRR